MSRRKNGEGDAGGQDEGAFGEPQLAINRVYTKKGDLGETSLVGGQKVKKNADRIEAYGTVDELNAFVGVVREGILAEPTARTDADLVFVAASLLRVQHELFNLGSLLATLPADVHPRQPKVTEVEVVALERDIDRCQEKLAPLRSFVLPGGSRLVADLHVARTVCRRAERLVIGLAQEEEVDPAAIRYLNRLSDALFVWGRFVAVVLQVEETLWQPNASASGAAHEPK